MGLTPRGAVAPTLEWSSSLIPSISRRLVLRSPAGEPFLPPGLLATTFQPPLSDPLSLQPTPAAPAPLQPHLVRAVYPCNSLHPGAFGVPWDPCSRCSAVLNRLACLRKRPSTAFQQRFCCTNTVLVLFAMCFFSALLFYDMGAQCPLLRMQDVQHESMRAGLENL